MKVEEFADRLDEECEEKEEPRTLAECAMNGGGVSEMTKITGSIIS